MEEKTCKECAHYRQHYILNGEKILRIYCGRCTVWPTKPRKSFKPACERFEQGTPDEEAFASKEQKAKREKENLIFVDAKEQKEKYAVPSAFHAYKFDDPAH